MGVIIETQQGKVEGLASGELQIFRGIPYARPPVGELRFRSPQPPEPWTGVRSASEFGPSAPQRDLPIAFPGWDVGPRDEDCLYLNVTTPAADEARRPVLVWIHGGAYILGSGSQKMYDPEPLAQRGDVVVVAINYRLGPFGFLHLDDLAGKAFGASGNAGTEDQVAALRWVRDNIEAFGGDPDNVTIFGESAGGMSVGTLLGTPAAAGLFHRAIPQSGAAHAINTREQASEVATGLLDILGIAASDAARLREQSVEQILAAQDELAGNVVGSSGGRMPFQPVVDGGALPRPPIEAIAAGLSAKVDVMIGTARDEWNLFAMLDPSQANLDEETMKERFVRWIGPEAKGLIEAFREVRGAETTAKDIYNAIQTDRIFRIPAVRLAEAQLAHPSRTYAYLFTWEAPLAQLGACHGIDIPFVFGAAREDTINMFTAGNPEAKELAEKVMDAWIAFARTGDPNHPGLDTWPSSDAERRPTMEFGKQCRVVDSPQDAERLAWEGIL
jgi:para-nitrobenzyl esterase